MKLAAIAFLALASPYAAAAAPDVRSAPYGTTADGEAVQVFTLTNDNGMSVKLLDYGGAIIEVRAPDRNGRFANVVLALPDLKTLEANGSVNTLIGRYANRIKGGFSLDGRHYALPANPKGITLHGGSPGYNGRIWKASPVESPRTAGVKLTLVSPDGDQGFPGTLNVSVTYTLTSTNELRLDYEAATDKPTILTLTSHVYFNMGGNGSGTVYDQHLQVLADNYTVTDEDQAPTGEIAPVAGTALDFRTLTPIGARIRSAEPQMQIARGYDHNFVLRKPRGEALPLAAKLYDPPSGRLLELRTTEPGLQVYSANHFNGTVMSAAGSMIRQSDAVALETQHFPNSPNRPNFPSTILRPGEVFRSTTTFHFTTDRQSRVR